MKRVIRSIKKSPYRYHSLFLITVFAILLIIGGVQFVNQSLVPSSAEDQNLVANGTFDRIEGEWQFTTSGKSEFSIKRRTGRIQIKKKNDTAELTQSLQLKPDTEYTLEYEAWANRSIILSVMVREEADPDTNLGIEETEKLRTKSKKYRYTFTTPANINGLSQLRFSFASQSREDDELFLDNVSLVEIQKDTRSLDVQNNTLVFEVMDEKNTELLKNNFSLNSEKTINTILVKLTQNSNISDLAKVKKIILPLFDKGTITMNVSNVSRSKIQDEETIIWISGDDNSSNANYTKIVLSKNLLNGSIFHEKKVYNLYGNINESIVLEELNYNNLTDLTNDIANNKTSTTYSTLTDNITSLQPQIIDILVLFSDAARSKMENNNIDISAAAINQVALTNDYFLKSGIIHKLNLVNVRRIDYVEDIDCKPNVEKLLNNNTLKQMRISEGADIVQVILDFVPGGDHGGVSLGCVGSLDVTQANSIAITHVNALNSGYVFQHEIGHLFGAGHQYSEKVTRTYAHALVANNPERLETMMVSRRTVGLGIGYYSNPNKSLFGINIGTASSNDNVRMINEMGPVLSDYYEAGVGGGASCSSYGNLGCGDVCQTACDCGDPATSGGPWQCKDIGFDGQTRCWSDIACGGESDRIRIKGTVKSCSGQPVADVSVSAMGNNVKTDTDGKWDLNKAFITWSAQEQKQVENYRTIELLVGADAGGSGYYTTVDNPQFIRGGVCGTSDTNINCSWQGSYQKNGGPVRSSYRVDGSRITSDGEKRLYRQYYTSKQEPEGETFNSFDFVPAVCNRTPDARIQSGPKDVVTNQTGTWKISATDADGNLQSSGTWIRKAGSSANWTQLRWIGNQKTGSINYDVSWKCESAGTYEMIVNARDTDGIICSGNPTQSSIKRCASGQDKWTITCRTQSTPTPTPTTSQATVQIRVQGRSNEGVTILPRLQLQIKNRSGTWNAVKTWDVAKKYPDEWATFTYTHTNNNLNIKDIRLYFVNDQGTDLRIDWIKLNGKTYQSEASSTFSTGTWSADNKCGEGYKQKEWLHCVGYFQYAQ